MRLKAKQKAGKRKEKLTIFPQMCRSTLIQSLRLKNRRIEGEHLGLFKMGAQDSCRKLGVAALAGIKELIMLPAGLTADLGSRVVGADIAIHVCMELLDELKQERVAGCLVEREVELKVQILEPVGIGLYLALGEDLGSLFEAFLGHKGDGRANGAHFENNAGVHRVLKLFSGELGYDGAAVGVDANESLSIELTESFANRNVADAELRRNLVLTKGHTAGENPADDRGAKNLEYPITGGH